VISVIADSEYTSVGTQIDIDLAVRIAEADTVPSGDFACACGFCFVDMRLCSIGTRSERYFTCQRAKKSRLHVLWSLGKLMGYRCVRKNSTVASDMVE
jgi:hypothetical protein